MPRNDSPSLDDYAGGLPSLAPVRTDRHRLAWIAVGILALVALLLGGAILARNNASGLLSGSGIVVGEVVDENSAPLQASVFVLGADTEAQTDSKGHFELKRVPAGPQTIIVAHLGAGREFHVTVDAGSITDMGQIRFVSTREPEA